MLLISSIHIYMQLPNNGGVFRPGASGFSGLEWWNEMVDWNGGMEYWNGGMEW